VLVKQFSFSSAVCDKILLINSYHCWIINNSRVFTRSTISFHEFSMLEIANRLLLVVGMNGKTSCRLFLILRLGWLELFQLFQVICLMLYVCLLLLVVWFRFQILDFISRFNSNENPVHRHLIYIFAHITWNFILYLTACRIT
jgi:hypothetical protein